MWLLRIHENKITIENNFNRYYLEKRDNITKITNYQKSIFENFLKIFECCLNLYLSLKDVRRTFFNRNMVCRNCLASFCLSFCSALSFELNELSFNFIQSYLTNRGYISWDNDQKTLYGRFLKILGLSYNF